MQTRQQAEAAYIQGTRDGMTWRGEDDNPYRDPELREAWRRGFEASGRKLKDEVD